MDHRPWTLLFVLVLPPGGRAAPVATEAAHTAFAAISGHCANVVDPAPIVARCISAAGVVMQVGDAVDLVLSPETTHSPPLVADVAPAVADAPGWAGALGAVQFVVRGGQGGHVTLHFPPIRFTAGRASDVDELWLALRASSESTPEATFQFIRSLADSPAPEIELTELNAVPLPAALWMLGSAVAGLAATSRRRRSRVGDTAAFPTTLSA